MAENNEVTLEVAKRERPEDAEESTDEPRTKQAKVDLKAEEAEAAPVESKNTAASNGTDEAKPEGTESAKDEAKDDSKADSKSGPEEEKLAPAAATTQTQASTPAVAHQAPAPAGVPAPTQQSYPPAVVNQAPVPTPAPAGVPVPTQQSYPLAGADTQVVEERGEVSALYVGRVIGKGGEMIRDLQARSACRIDVDQNVPPGQPRVITYRGTRKTVDFAKHLVIMLCQENASDADLPLGEAKREYLVVPAPSVGKIIGRGGEMIRELQSRSQAKIQVDHTGNSGLDSNEKQVTITGTELAVRKATEMVLFLVANPLMDAILSINMLAESKLRGGQWGSGPPYPDMQNQGQNMQPDSGGGGGGGGYDGYNQQQYYGGAQASGYGPPAAAPAPAAAQYSSYSAAPPAYQQQQQASYGQYGSGGGGGGVEVEMFYAAKTFMGRIIGQKGCTINDLQRRSACDIQINQDVAAGQDCEITMKGSRQGIEMSKQMLREIIEVGPNHPYAGGNYNGGGGQQGGGQQQGAYGQQAQQSYGYQQQASYGQGYNQQQPNASGYGRQMDYQAQSQATAYSQPQAAQYQASHAYGGNPAPQAAPSSEWKSATAPDGQIYYYNQRTGETQWEKPMGMH